MSVANEIFQGCQVNLLTEDVQVTIVGTTMPESEVTQMTYSVLSAVYFPHAMKYFLQNKIFPASPMLSHSVSIKYFKIKQQVNCRIHKQCKLITLISNLGALQCSYLKRGVDRYINIIESCYRGPVQNQSKAAVHITLLYLV